MLVHFLLLTALLPAFLATDQQRVQLCTCAKASACASEGSGQIENCKEECADHLSSYAPKEKKNGTEPVTGCFWMKSGAEGERMTKCMSGKIDNFCVEESANSSSLANPDYARWMESLSNSSAADSSKSGSAFIRKARAAFIVFRNFQKCMNNCAKRHSTACFKKASCAISLPSERAKSLSIYNECTLQNVHKDAREACRCLIQKHKVYQLVGICPLMSNTFLMRMI